MNHYALDLDKKTAFAQVFNSTTQTQSESRIELNPANLIQLRNTLRSDDILCMEACPGSFYLHDFLSVACKVRVVDAISFGAYLSIFKHKMDRDDTGLMLRLDMANALRIVWVPNLQKRDERAYARHYKSLDNERTRLRNRLQALLVE